MSPTDRPDYQESVDIEAQSLADLDINIVAQTLGQLNVNLAASAITLNVNLSASAITLNINISGQTSTIGLWMQAEHSARAGTDKNFFASGTGKSNGQGVYAQYTVPTGKTLFITSFGAKNVPNAASIYTSLMHCFYYLLSGATILAQVGALGGGATVLPKPFTLAAGVVLEVGMINEGGEVADVAAWANGYEV